MAIERLRYDEQPERLPPHNREAEEAILGSVLLDRTVIDRVAPIVGAADFYEERNGVVYAAMRRLRERLIQVDYMTLLDELDRDGQLASAGGTTRLAALLGAVPTPIHAEHYARIVADAAFMRRLASAGGKISTLAWANQDPPERAFERAEQILASVLATLGTDSMVPQVDVLLEAREHLAALRDPERRARLLASTLPTTIKQLDELLGGGLAKGDLVLLAGRPSMGKSALAGELLRIMCDAYRTVKAAYFTMEMTSRAMILRQLSAASGIPLARWNDASLSVPQLRVFAEKLGELAELDIVWDQSSSLTVDALKTRVKRRALSGGLDVVVVDHIQLVDGPDGGDANRTAQVTAISKGLKELARDLNVAVITLCQLSRAVEQRPDKVPLLADLRESGSLEQDADVVGMLYREEYYKPTETNRGVAKLFVRKNRNGPTGEVDLTWNPETTRFRGTEWLGI